MPNEADFMKSFTLKKMLLAALFAALACVATMVISFPIPATQGYINMGDCMVLMSGWILGGLYGALAGGIGSALADLLLGYTVYAPGTFIIKALMAAAAFLVFTALKNKLPSPVSRIISGICAEAIMVAGYFLYESVFLGYGLGAVPSIFSNLIQACGGLVLSVLIMEIIKSNRYIAGVINHKA